jgi:hypothetical protein
MFNFSKKEKNEPKDIEEVLKALKFLEDSFNSVSSELEAVKRDQVLSIQKVGMVRFNPFREGGGDQSFSLALLDKNNSGVIVTSLYSREGNRIYGKPIKDGNSAYTLSEEENKAIEEAKKTDDNGKK